MAEVTDADLPAGAALAWGLKTSTGRNTEEGLSADKIVRAAVELADNAGIAGLTIRKLGARLGFTSMAVYRHVTSKDELLVLMVEAGLGEPPSDILEAETWQESLTRWALAISTRYQEHPWLLDATPVGLPTTPNYLLWIEYVLQGMSKADLELNEKLDCALLVDGHARNAVNLAKRYERDTNSASESQKTNWLPGLLTREKFPLMSRVLTGGEFQDGSDFGIEFGLKRIIAGIETMIEQKQKQNPLG